MIVTRSNFGAVLGILAQHPTLSLDSETTGLRPYHGDRLFSLIVGVSPTEAFYFNFQPYPNLEPEKVLRPSHLALLQPLFQDTNRLWYVHNAKYDMHILAQEGIFLAGTIHCTRALARVEYNEYTSYSLGSCAERIGVAKDDRVEEYIKDHHLWDWHTRPGKKQRGKLKYFDRVPFDIIQPYGETDATVGYRLGQSQAASFAIVANAQRELPEIHRLSNIVDNERSLTKTIFAMEQRGVLIDIPYTKRAVEYEEDRATKALGAFKAATGKSFSASNKLFQEVFAEEKSKWGWTEKGNPSFEGDILKGFESPAARAILDYRDAKSKCDFYLGFLYHADGSGVLHPNFNPDGTRTGRFSSSDPNLQNLTDEEGLEAQEFLVRRAIIPRPGQVFLLPDFQAMEFRLMLDYSAEMELIEKVKSGLDLHQATADLMGVTRKEAKTISFMLLYGGGVQKLADSLGVSLESARDLKAKYFATLPGVQKLIQAVQEAVHARGFIRNWAGRRVYYPDKELAYHGPNALIQSGCADVMKFAMVQVARYLQETQARMLLSIHDELCIEVPESDALEVGKQVQRIMESVYPFQSLPLTVGLEWSTQSLGDKIKLEV